MDNHSPTNAPEPLLAAWIKWTMDFWESMAHMGPGPQELTGGAEDFCEDLALSSAPPAFWRKYKDYQLEEMARYFNAKADELLARNEATA